ncbi:hypothetical protein KUTeg_022383 [Tegillarca granosa]|uniref:Uncharacterized protein n=1 Tax=Tegillarca granosa TaxID=220873 RepID=A0ABQ9E688_TEGGR|nr:hypothetical protein KUTeg_022383 [Tegillarca granosa]
MASLSQRKPNISENNRNFLSGVNVRLNRDTPSSDIHGISSWKREQMSKPENLANEGNTSNCVFESKSVPVINIEENGNDIVFNRNDLLTNDRHLKTRMGSGTPRDSKNSPTPSQSSNMEDKGSIITSHLKHVQSNPFFKETGVKHSHGKVGEDKPSTRSSLTVEEQNGPVITSHLKHVHSNPFFQDCGLDHPHGSTFNDRASSGSNSPVFQNDDDSNIDNETTKNESGPFSGIVGKRRKVFLQAQNAEKTFKPIRRFASLENLLDSKRSKTTSGSLASPTEKVSGRLLSDSSSRDKTPTFYKTVVNKPVIPKPVRQKPSQVKTSDSSNDYTAPPKRDRHQAADLDMGRKDIIIIEQPKPKSPKPEDTEIKENKFSGFNSVKPLKDDNREDELPKQNIVSSVRSIFESGSKSAGLRSRCKDVPRSPTLHKPPIKPKTSLTSNNKTSEELPQTAESTTPDVVRKSLPSSSESSTGLGSLPLSTNNKETTQSSVFPSIDTSSETVSSVKPSISGAQVKEEGMFDSPLAKKRERNEKKSIFDSKVIIPKESPKLKPKVKKEIHKNDTDQKISSVFPEKKVEEDVIETKQKSVSEIVAQRNLSPTPRSMLVNHEKSKKIEKSEVGVSSVNNTSKPLKSDKKTASVADDKKLVSNEYFPGRKEIFDSSMIKPVQEHSSDERKSRPPRPKNRVTKKNSSEGKTGETSVPSVKLNNLINEEKKESKQDILNENLKSNTKVVNSAKTQEEQKENDKPTKGVPSIMLERYKKDKMKVAGQTDLYKPDNSVNDSDTDLLKPSMLKNRFHAGSLSSPVPKKRQAPQPPKDSPVLNNTNNIAASVKLKPARGGRTNIDDLIGGNRRSSPSAVFDSSNIIPTSTPVVNGNLEPLTKLDLSSLTQDPVLDHPYQEGYIPSKIQPCTIQFKGAGVKFDQNPLKKTRSNQKLKISFDENAKTH